MTWSSRRARGPSRGRRPSPPILRLGRRSYHVSLSGGRARESTASTCGESPIASGTPDGLGWLTTVPGGRRPRGRPRRSRSTPGAPPWRSSPGCTRCRPDDAARPSAGELGEGRDARRRRRARSRRSRPSSRTIHPSRSRADRRTRRRPTSTRGSLPPPVMPPSHSPVPSPAGQAARADSPCRRLRGDHVVERAGPLSCSVQSAVDTPDAKASRGTPSARSQRQVMLPDEGCGRLRPAFRARARGPRHRS